MTNGHDEIICHCLKVSEDEIREAIEVYGDEDLSGIRVRTGAGDGCRACRRHIRRFFIPRQSLSRRQRCEAG